MASRFVWLFWFFLTNACYRSPYCCNHLGGIPTSRSCLLSCVYSTNRKDSSFIVGTNHTRTIPLKLHLARGGFTAESETRVRSREVSARNWSREKIKHLCLQAGLASSEVFTASLEGCTYARKSSWKGVRSFSAHCTAPVKCEDGLGEQWSKKKKLLVGNV